MASITIPAGLPLCGVSPALRAVASDFSLRGQRKVTKRKATPRQSDRFAVALGSVARSGGPPQMGHPCPAAAAPSSLMALLTLFPPLGGLEGEPIPCPTVTKGAFASQLAAMRRSERWGSQFSSHARFSAIPHNAVVTGKNCWLKCEAKRNRQQVFCPR
ncbi:hypothetical protein D3C85_678540 [compost metagenome]